MIAFLSQLGPRARQRAAPRAGVTLAAVGCVIAVIGVLSIGGDNLGDIDTASGGGGSRVPGIFLTLLVTAAGYLVLAIARRGPLAAAGSVAAALGVPSLAFFLTYSDTSGPNVDALLLISTVAWLLSYVFGPARSRPFFLALALVGTWLFVVEQVEPVLGFAFFFRLLVFPIETAFGGQPPDFTNVGLLSGGFGLAYLALAWVLDRDGYTGAATPSTFVGLVALFSGIAALSTDLEATGTGVVLAAVGVGLVLVGALVRRRATTWLGGLSVLVGTTAVIGDAVGDSPVSFGVMSILVGLGAIALAEWVAAAMEEPDEVTVDPAPPVDEGVSAWDI